MSECGASRTASGWIEREIHVGPKGRTVLNHGHVIPVRPRTERRANGLTKPMGWTRHGQRPGMLTRPPPNGGRLLPSDVEESSSNDDRRQAGGRVPRAVSEAPEASRRSWHGASLRK